MATTIFDRYYEITFKELVTRANTTSYLQLYTLSSDDVEESEALQVKGTINKSLKSSGDSPNSVLKLSILNLPKDIISQLNSADILRVEVRLGYNNHSNGTGDSPLISKVFTGDVKGILGENNGLNFTLKFAAIEGITAKTGSELTQVVRAGTSIQSTLKSIVKTFSEVYISSKDSTKKTIIGGVSTVFEANILQDNTFSNDRTFEGSTTKVLTELCNELKVSWSFQDDSVHIYRLSQRDKVTNYNLIPIDKSVVIGGITGNFDNVGENKKEASVSSEIKVKTFLDPRTDIQTIYQVSKDFDEKGLSYSGNYLLNSWTFNFDYRGKNWETILNLTRTKLTEVVTDG